jgi:hypothetical protein
MGKSNELVFPWYVKNLPENAERVAILGSTSDSFVRQKYPNALINLYDIQLGNWDINADVWNIESSAYDLVVITRCAYFSKDPNNLIDKCMKILCAGGHLFIDWGLGDHWRFKNYKVGWVKDEEHEFAYYEDNFLWSTAWSHSLLAHPQVQIFAERIKKYGYNNIETAINAEIPSIYKIGNIDDILIKVDALALWEENPQLYILTIFQKSQVCKDEK